MREMMIAIRATLVLWILTALIYPFFMLSVGLILPYQANGSLIKNTQGQVIGSALIGQSFTDERYFWSRPSTTNYSSFTTQEFDPKNPDNIAQRTGISGASNLAPSNTQQLLNDNRQPNTPDLLKRINETVAQLKQANIQPTADLVYTSGSSLDPHISIEAARAQIDRVAKARSLDTNQVEILVSKATDGRFIGIFGEPGVNVLKLNLALDLLIRG
ncbi:MAG TPA: K(+)-transporting ATPase subunit C [Cyanobacteria bacterium UBA12227]|nr:K(+)-transporting ATPase subunit C [Cyanobacteria bacterium UBA12227]HAX89049.1 K(+)-transporting ATPase subunit C [Cyanobacteria bacterium UBA11370]HBY78027.1 K(+)-transporting ATPase subunit C [Cyanobacteria bacterium UBA11148]